MKNEKHKHQPVVIGSGRFHRIDMCSCGAIHIHAGEVSLHIHRERFQDLCATLLSANQRIEGQLNRMN